MQKKLQKIYLLRYKFLILASLLSNFVRNPSNEIHKTECKYRNKDKKYKTYGITYQVWRRFLE